MEFHIGQKVVCIKTHPDKYCVKDAIYIIKSIVSGCKCNDVYIDIGLKDEGCDEYITECLSCGYDYISKDSTIWLSSYRFKPLQEQEFKQVTWEKITEEISRCAN